MDEKYYEQASALEQAQRDQALHLIQAQVQGSGQADCDICGELIPPARRAAAPGAIRCIHCQTTFERMQKNAR